MFSLKCKRHVVEHLILVKSICYIFVLALLWTSHSVSATTLPTATPTTSHSSNITGYHDYIRGEDGLYYKYHDSSMNWCHAKSTCESEGAHLAIIYSLTTFEYIKKTYIHKGIWLGAMDVNSSNSWNWLNGVPMSNDYWAPGEPNNWNGLQEDCIVIWKEGFHDAPCWWNAPKFLCQIDKTSKVYHYSKSKTESCHISLIHSKYILNQVFSTMYHNNTRTLYSCIVMDFTNIMIHGVGIFLLISLYRSGEKKTQDVYILNLSCAELLASILGLVYSILGLLDAVFKYNLNPDIVISVFMMWGISMGNILSAMYYITGDRLCCVMMPTYQNCWTIRKTWILITVTWLWYVISSVGWAIRIVHRGIDYFAIFSFAIGQQVIMALASLYVLFALTTYIAIFVKFVQSRWRFVSSIINILRDSKFSAAVTIIFTYLIFTNAPSIVLAATYIQYFSMKDQKQGLVYLQSVISNVWIYANISYRISITVDALIYVFLQKKVRKLFLKKFNCGTDARLANNNIRMNVIGPAP